jgi:hypothetical protein
MARNQKAQGIAAQALAAMDNDAADLARMALESAIMGSEDTLAGMAATEAEGAALAASEDQGESTEAPTNEGESEDQGPADEKETDAANFAAQFDALGGNLPRGICKALRAIAKDYAGPRKDFIASAAAMGLNPGNAAAEWQAGRKA